MTDEEKRAKHREYMREYNAKRKGVQVKKFQVIDQEPERHPTKFANETTPKQRVEHELGMVQEWYTKLCVFIHSNNSFKKLPEAQQQLLKAQVAIQSSYIDILKARLQIWE